MEPCAERDELFQLLIEAVAAYNDAVHSMSAAEGNAFHRARKLAETACATYEDRREAFVAHELSHGCAAKTMAASGS
jgi:hypothetical protein